MGASSAPPPPPPADGDLIGLQYGSQSILLIDPSATNPDDAVKVVQHYQEMVTAAAVAAAAAAAAWPWRTTQQDSAAAMAMGYEAAVAKSLAAQQRTHDRMARAQTRLRDGGPGGASSVYAEAASTSSANGGGSGNLASGEPAGSTAAAAGREDSMRELEELLTKLNPLAKEFVPPSASSSGAPSSAFSQQQQGASNNGASADASSAASSSSKTGPGGGRKKNGLNAAKKKVPIRSARASRDDSVRRTVYVSDIDQQVTEEQLAALFISCGQVVDCRVCGDPNSVLRFAFVEFTDEEGARAALSLAGTVLGYYPVRVLPSKTAILPVNPTFLPRSEDERELCARTIYCTNIDKKVTQADVKLFFESLCGEVSRLRLLGDYIHSTRIAFVEFIMAESAMAALNCSGAILGSLPIRVSPSKTPVRPRTPRSPAMH
eukprot:SM000028S10201  [mRNA]  locus=s28:987492:990479:+ [translate_table: standard]